MGEKGGNYERAGKETKIKLVKILVTRFDKSNHFSLTGIFHYGLLYYNLDSSMMKYET